MHQNHWHTVTEHNQAITGLHTVSSFMKSFYHGCWGQNAWRSVQTTLTIKRQHQWSADTAIQVFKMALGSRRLYKGNIQWLFKRGAASVPTWRSSNTKTEDKRVDGSSPTWGATRSSRHEPLCKMFWVFSVSKLYFSFTDFTGFCANRFWWLIWPASWSPKTATQFRVKMMKTPCRCLTKKARGRRKPAICLSAWTENGNHWNNFLSMCRRIVRLRSHHSKLTRPEPALGPGFRDQTAPVWMRPKLP